MYASESVPRGIWLQYGDIPEDPNEGVFMQVTDVPITWLKGALGIDTGNQNLYVKSLTDLCGFPKTPVKLGQVAQANEVGECVVAVPFIETDGERKFFTIPKQDVLDVKSALRREVEPGVFIAGGPPKAGNSVIDMVKKMKKYVFPPSMDFVKYEEIDPFAMYIFEFKHTFSKQDLADMWQNLPPKIGRSFAETEVTLSHELLAHELLGGGSVIKDDKLDLQARGEELTSDIQWMLFKVKQRAKTNYWDKVVAKKGTTADTSGDQLENVSNSDLGETSGITYNWPYDFFSLVELVKLDAEVTFTEIEVNDQGTKAIKDIIRQGAPSRTARGDRAAAISKAKGNKKGNR